MAWKTGLSSGGPNHCAFNHDSGAHIFPERDQQLARQRHDRRLAPTTAATFHSVLEPESERRARLMAYPKPSELIIVVRSRGLPDCEMPCSRLIDPLCQGVGARPA